ncbi:50S ribosomal protein L20 [bacterium]|nr:50S ribosomal protein L20 [bacterium]
MTRVKRGIRGTARRKRVMKLSKGFRGGRRNLFRTAREAVDKAMTNAYRDRKRKKRDFRKLWIIRINAATRMQGLTYASFIAGLNRAGVQINRKMLADLAVREPAALSELITTAKTALKKSA